MLCLLFLGVLFGVIGIVAFLRLAIGWSFIWVMMMAITLVLAYIFYLRSIRIRIARSEIGSKAAAQLRNERPTEF
jgi:hypothetical protein